jgi:hypothetical protein
MYVVQEGERRTSVSVHERRSIEATWQDTQATTLKTSPKHTLIGIGCAAVPTRSSGNFAGFSLA